MPDNETLARFRRTLHAHPEPSGAEHATHDRIAAFLRAHAPDARLVENLGATGLAAVINPDHRTRTILYRSDHDALRIHERTDAPHASTTPGVMHACGHDGHTTIACALASRLAADPPESARVVFLFQPAEETGTGARAVLDDPRAADLAPDAAIAIHNLPAVPLGRVVVREGIACPASVGLELVFDGVPGHSAEPRVARSPLAPAAALIDPLTYAPQTLRIEHALVTVTTIDSGPLDFGRIPARVTLGATLRAHTDTDLTRLTDHATTLARAAARAHGLTLTVREHEPFPALINDTRVARAVRDRLGALGHDTIEPAHAFPWSEDFAHIARACPAVLLGIGAGEDTPHLHADTYDYPDALTPIAATTLEHLIRTLCAGCG